MTKITIDLAEDLIEDMDKLRREVSREEWISGAVIQTIKMFVSHHEPGSNEPERESDF
jgi:metal-responsive CopG/Arc/MetJ family transcriptional regulator